MTHGWSKLLTLFVASLVAYTVSEARADDWGTLSGRFLLDGKAPVLAPLNAGGAFGVAPDESVVVGPNGELANVVVWLRAPKDVVSHPDYRKLIQKKAVIDNHGCRFDPHIAICCLGQTLEIKNTDPIAHNTVGMLQTNSVFSFILRSDQSRELKPFAMAEPVPVALSCNAVPWMKGWLVVPPTPYAAVSGNDGNFEIRNLPVGTELEFQAWQEKKGFLDKATINGKEAGWTKGRFKMTIKPGDNDLGDIKVAL
jgi:hypothetical protein